MAINVNGPHSGPKEAVKAFAKARRAHRLPDLYEFIDVLYDQNVFDAFMICGQSSHETSSWTDDKWDRLNPAGIGVLPNLDLGYDFKSGTEAAKAMLIHHAAYTGTVIPQSWEAWIPLDPRYDAVFEKGFNGRVTYWEDYGDGYWATDPHYFEGIMDHVTLMRTYISGEEETPTKPDGGIMPNIIDKWLHVAQDGYAAVHRRYIGRGGMSPKVIFLHIQEGNNWGSWTWFHVVSASCTVMVAKNGDIWRLVPESDGPWTNGDVINPTAKGREMLNLYGPDPNYYSLTIETEGFTGEWPKDQRQLDSVVWQIKNYMRKYSIPLKHIYRHADVNQRDRPDCPGNTFYNYVIDRIQKEGLGDVVDKPTFATPNKVVVNGKEWDGKTDVKVNGIVFHGEVQAGIVAATQAIVHQYATKNSAPTRSPIPKNTKFSVRGWVNGEKVGNESRWWITKNFGRVWVGNTVQKPKNVVDDKDDVEALPSGVKLLNGRVYYPTRKDDKMERSLLVTEDTTLYKSATLSSEKVGTAKKGDVITVAYYVSGDTVQNEQFWYVIKSGSDPLTQGARIHASATSERPD